MRVGDLPPVKEFGTQCAPVLLEIKEPTMKITVCENRFEVIAEMLEPEEVQELMDRLQDWVLEKRLPSDEVYMAALGPCGK